MSRDAWYVMSRGISRGTVTWSVIGVHDDTCTAHRRVAPSVAITAATTTAVAANNSYHQSPFIIPRKYNVFISFTSETL